MSGSDSNKSWALPEKISPKPRVTSSVWFELDQDVLAGVAVAPKILLLVNNSLTAERFSLATAELNLILNMSPASAVLLPSFCVKLDCPSAMIAQLDPKTLTFAFSASIAE